MIVISRHVVVVNLNEFDETWLDRKCDHTAETNQGLNVHMQGRSNKQLRCASFVISKIHIATSRIQDAKMKNLIFIYCI